jgi:hypothetical protein
MEQKEIKLTPSLIILKAIEVKNLVVKNWKLVLIVTLICGAIGYWVDSKKKNRDVYVATTVFNMVSGGPDMGSLAGLGMLGLGGQADAGMFSGENFFYLAKTRPIIERALSTPITIGKRTDYFINFYLDSTYIRQDDFEAPWEEHLRKAKFTKDNIDRKNMSDADLDCLGRVFMRIRDETDMRQEDKKLSYITLSSILENEQLSKIWAELLLETLEDAYQKFQTKKSREMMRIMQRRVDSLSAVLNHTESKLARVTDVNIDAVVVQGRVDQTRLTRNSTFVTSLYLEASRNLENLKMSIIKESPLFTVVEPVYLPLDKRVFKIDNTIFGLIIGLFLSALILIVRETYKSALREESNLAK